MHHGTRYQPRANQVAVPLQSAPRDSGRVSADERLEDGTRPSRIGHSFILRGVSRGPRSSNVSGVSKPAAWPAASRAPDQVAIRATSLSLCVCLRGQARGCDNILIRHTVLSYRTLGSGLTYSRVCISLRLVVCVR